MPVIEHIGPELKPGRHKLTRVSYAGGCLNPVNVGRSRTWVNMFRSPVPTGEIVTGNRGEYNESVEELYAMVPFAHSAYREVFVRCNTCPTCVAYRMFDWQEVNEEQLRRAGCGVLTTLTFSPAWWKRTYDDHWSYGCSTEETLQDPPTDYDPSNNLHLKFTHKHLGMELTLWLKRVRYYLKAKKYGINGRIQLKHYFSVFEIGEQKRRLHIHLNMFFHGCTTADFPLIKKILSANWVDDEGRIGRSDFRLLDEAGAGYAAKYIGGIKKLEGKATSTNCRLRTSLKFWMPHDERKRKQPEFRPGGTPVPANELSGHPLDPQTFISNAAGGINHFNWKQEKQLRQQIVDDEQRQHSGAMSLSEQLEANQGRWTYRMISGVRSLGVDPLDPQQLFWEYQFPSTVERLDRITHAINEHGEVVPLPPSDGGGDDG